MLLSIFLIMDRHTICLTLMLTSFLRGVRIPDFIFLFIYYYFFFDILMCVLSCLVFLQSACWLLQVYISIVQRLFCLFQSSFIRREQSFEEFRDQFDLLYLWFNYFSIVVLNDQQFLRLLWFYLSHSFMVSICTIFVFINFLCLHWFVCLCLV